MKYDKYNPDKMLTTNEIALKVKIIGTRQIQRILKEMVQEKIAWKVAGIYITSEKNWNEWVEEDKRING